MFRSYIILLLLFSQTIALGISRQNIRIQSDHMQLNIKTRTTIYIGHVLIETPELQLQGEKIIIQRNKNDQIASIIDHGYPARYLDQSNQQKTVKAHAHIIEIYPPKHLVILKNKAFIKQASNIIRAPIIHYDTENHILSALGNKKTQIQMHVLMNHKI